MAEKDAKEKEQRPVRLGIIGSGLAVKYLHFPPLRKLRDRYEIVVACDINPASAQEIAELAAKDLGSRDVKTTTDYREVLASPDVEAVLISLPIHLNAQIMLEAAQAGKHIIAEKPLAANLEQAQQLAATLRGFPNLAIEIAENYRYREDFAKAREWIDAGRIGKLYLLQVQVRFWTNSNEGFASTPWRWRNDMQYRGGLVADAGVHYAAAFREIAGELEQVQAFTSSNHPNIGGPDTIIMNMRFRSGVLGSWVYTGAAHSADTTPFQAHLYGTEGTIVLDGRSRVLLHKGENQNAKIAEEYKVEDFDNGYLGEFDNFWRAIRLGEAIRATVDESLKDLALIMRALDSAEMRSVVLL
jgi:predicted dehydrogenase